MKLLYIFLGFIISSCSQNKNINSNTLDIEEYSFTRQEKMALLRHAIKKSSL